MDRVTDRVSPPVTPLAPEAPSVGTGDLCEVTCVDEVTVGRARQGMPAPESVAVLAETFRTLGDPTRLRLVAALAQAELCVCDLATLLSASQSTVSHSLRALRQLRLVRYRKEGKIAYYSLDDGHIAALLAEGLRHVEERDAPAAARGAATAG